MTILVADDDRNICDSLAWLLRSEGHTVQTCGSGEEAVALCRQEPFDVVFLDVMMPGMGGLAALTQIVALHPPSRVVMISGQADLGMAVQATKAGAWDFLEKPLHPEKVILEIAHLRKELQIHSQVTSLRKLVEQDYELVGQSPAMDVLRQTIAKAAPSEGRILIFGENGTGKELVAREIHRASLRAEKAFVQLNCAALPRELIESELFGYEKGAFTGAVQRKPGLIEQAEGGTLLLDEIGDMALDTQAKLLRVFQENEYYRLGSTAPRRFDVRIIAATNKELQAEIAQGRFRQDLYFRLHVIPITVPPLRERAGDIPELAVHFISAICQRNGKKQKHLTPAAMTLLQNYHWPGNVRELRNIIERLVIMVEAERMDAEEVRAVLGGGSLAAETIPEADFSHSFRDQVQAFEKNILLRGLQHFDGNISRLAAALHIDRANLHRKLRRYGISHDK